MRPSDAPSSRVLNTTLLTTCASPKLMSAKYTPLARMAMTPPTRPTTVLLSSTMASASGSDGAMCFSTSAET